MAQSRPLRSSGNRVAVTVRHHGPNAPQTVAARRDHAEVRIADFIRRTVDQAPELTAEQRDRLALLLAAAPAPACRPTTRPAA